MLVGILVRHVQLGHGRCFEQRRMSRCADHATACSTSVSPHLAPDWAVTDGGCE
jgi:hypothetical protein